MSDRPRACGLSFILFYKMDDGSSILILTEISYNIKHYKPNI